MRELDLYRRTQRRVIQREIGQLSGPESTSIHFDAELVNLQADTTLARHPEDVAGATQIQGPGGGWVFMVDVSIVDGPDPIL